MLPETSDTTTYAAVPLQPVLVYIVISKKTTPYSLVAMTV